MVLTTGQMLGTPQSRPVRKLRGFSGILLLVIVCGLLVHLVGRYSADSWRMFSNTRIADSGQPDAKHQHLDSDHVKWVPSRTEFRLFLVSVCEVPERTVAEPPLVVHLDDSLYNRPPPSRQAGIRSFARILA